MSETAVKKEKKKWSTGKKVAVILCSVLLALILIVVSGGLIYLHNYCQVKDYTVTAMGNHDVTLIAHRGFRAVAPENTLPAFEGGRQGRIYRRRVRHLSHQGRGVGHLSRQPYLPYDGSARLCGKKRPTTSCSPTIRTTG